MEIKIDKKRIGSIKNRKFFLFFIDAKFYKIIVLF